MTGSGDDFPDRLARGFARVSGGRPTAVLLAVSGGRDSMTLLHAALRLHRGGRLERLGVAHLDHGLRGPAGRADREFVEAVARDAGLPCLAEQLDAGVLAARSRGSLEAAAREARYEFLLSAAQRLQFPQVATAHHQGDQAETVLHNALRGTGLRGLRGIPARRRLSADVVLIRPMLHIDADIIRSWAAEQQVPYRTDASNADPGFLRNRIRRDLLPRLHRDINARAAAHLSRLADGAAELLDCVDALADDLLERAVLDRQPDAIRLQRSVLMAAPEPLLRHALTVVWQRQNWPRRDLSTDHWLRMAAAIHAVDPASPQSASLPGGLQFEVRGDLVRVRAVPPPQVKPVRTGP